MIFLKLLGLPFGVFVDRYIPPAILDFAFVFFFRCPVGVAREVVVELVPPTFTVGSNRLLLLVLSALLSKFARFRVIAGTFVGAEAITVCVVLTRRRSYSTSRSDVHTRRSYQNTGIS